MNPFALPSLICMFIMPFLGTFIYYRNRRSQVNILFFVLTAAILYWAFTEFNIRQSESYSAALFWIRAGCFKILLGPILIHFILVYIDKWKDYNRLQAFVLTYVPALLLAISDLLFGTISGTPVKESWGWTPGIPGRPSVLIIYFAWNIVAFLFTAKESVAFAKRADNNERKSYYLLLSGLITAMVLGTLSATVSCMLRPDFPELSILVALLFAAYLTFIIWKYDIFLSPYDTAENIIELMGDCLVLTGTHNHILRVNKAMLQLSGYVEKELIGMDFSFLINDTSDSYDKRVTIGKVISKETRLISKTGQSVPVLLSQTFVNNKSNTPIATITIAKDLTFWQKAQQEFIQAEKLESFELIIRGIAHDFNNLLTAITGHLSIAETTENLSESLRKNITIAEKAAYVATNLIKQLSTYAKENDLLVSICNLPEIIKESSDLALKVTHIKLDFHSDGNLWPISADKFRMIQVFINLFINARQAMMDAGKITVRCANHLDGEQKEYVNISVHDDGKGISSDIIGKVFEPFFTTKQQGSGLGLSIVKNIIETHHGTVTVESGQDTGTTFTILLPKAADLDKPVVSDIPLVENIPLKRFLVMDDDELVLSTFSMILSQIGHTSQYARNGSEAIDIFTRAKDNSALFDCVILDLNMVSGIGAEQVVKRIQEINPQVRAILTSGYGTHPIIDNYEHYGFHSVLKKPFNLTDVQEAISLAFKNIVAV